MRLSNTCTECDLHKTRTKICWGVGATNFQMVDWFQPVPIADLGTSEMKKWSEYVPLLKDFPER